MHEITQWEGHWVTFIGPCIDVWINMVENVQVLFRKYILERKNGAWLHEAYI